MRVKIIEHTKGSGGACSHPGTRWDTALERARLCMRVSISAEQEKAIIAALSAGRTASHAGYTLKGEA